jgi:Arylsulfotransferase (ASST)
VTRGCWVVRAATACAAAACATAAAAGPASADAARPVRAEPGLDPGFERSTPDYTVRCAARRRLRLTIDPPDGTRVAVGGGAAHAEPFERSLALAPGEGIRLRFVAGDRTRTYGIRCLPSDFPRFNVKLRGSRQAGWYLLTPNDFRRDARYVTVIDSRGVPVWWMRRKPAPFDVHLLPDGNLAWAPFAANTPGAGPFEVFSLAGEPLRKYTTVGWITNQHDLQVQDDGSAYLITYRPREHVDLSRWGGPSDAIVLDGEIQQVDSDGKLLWRWSTKKHLKVRETGRWLQVVLHKNRPISLPDGRPSYDLVHLNSVEPYGNRLVFSARHEDAVYEIDRRSGKVLWKLGGAHTSRSLKIRGGLDPARFGGNHDARVLDGGRIVTLYDNQSLYDRPPRALAFRIDRKKRTATLISEIRFPHPRDSVCCGSARLLPGGNWVIGWGHTPWVTEQRPDGRPVFELHFADRRFSSYRAVPVMRGELARAALRRGMDAMAGQ